MVEGKKVNTQQIAVDFVSEFNRFQQQKELTITNLDFNNPVDQKIILETLLRDKSEDEYFSLVGGLIVAADDSENKQLKNSLIELASTIMSIGQDNLGIDWS